MRRTITVSLTLLPLVLVLGWAAAGSVLAGGGCHGGDEAMATEGNSTVVKMDGCTFAPTVTRVPLGAEVRFLNTSLASHDVTGRNREWGTARLDVGASFATRFGTAGVYPYSCSLHPGMAGVVIVGSVPAAAADTTDTPDIAPAVATAPATPTSADSGPAPYLAVGALGLLAGVGLGAAVARRRRPA